MPGFSYPPKPPSNIYQWQGPKWIRDSNPCVAKSYLWIEEENGGGIVLLWDEGRKGLQTNQPRTFLELIDAHTILYTLNCFPILS